ncbi:MAG: VWA domain-containing protein [Clostridia bacterium]|nr:VWA domain-containing protein [Clostridia bacterium]
MNKTVYFVIDCSGSMHGSRADAVNTAMQKVVQEAIPEIKAQKNNDLQISFKVLGFSDAFSGKVCELMPKTDLDDFTDWDFIDQETFNGGTPTGAALQAVIDDLKGGNRGEPDMNAVAPAIILISDGEPNGSSPTYEEVLKCAEKGNPDEVKMFRKALRVALGICVDERGRESLVKFGKLSDKLEKAGYKSYYDCSDTYVDDFVNILKSMTVNMSIG